MTLNNNLTLIFSSIIKNKKRSLKLIEYIKKIESKGLINNLMILSLVKSLIIIISYYPKKEKFIYNFIKLIYKSNSDTKKNLCKLLNQIDFINYEDLIDDEHMDKIIFKTFDLIEQSHKINQELPLILLNEIVISVFKIKSNDLFLKI